MLDATQFEAPERRRTRGGDRSGARAWDVASRPSGRQSRNVRPAARRSPVSTFERRHTYDALARRRGGRRRRRRARCRGRRVPAAVATTTSPAPWRSRHRPTLPAGDAGSSSTADERTEPSAVDRQRRAGSRATAEAPVPTPAAPSRCSPRPPSKRLRPPRRRRPTPRQWSADAAPTRTCRPDVAAARRRYAARGQGAPHDEHPESRRPRPALQPMTLRRHLHVRATVTYRDRRC